MGEMALTGSDLVMVAMEKVRPIREKLITAQCRQKSYYNVRKKRP